MYLIKVKVLQTLLETIGFQFRLIDEERNTKRTKSDTEDLQCDICKNVLHEPITCLPCLHSYCGACFSDIMDKEVKCPRCGNAVTKIKQNKSLNEVIEKYLTVIIYMKIELS